MAKSWLDHLVSTLGALAAQYETIGQRHIGEARGGRLRAGTRDFSARAEEVSITPNWTYDNLERLRRSSIPSSRPSSLAMRLSVRPSLLPSGQVPGLPTECAL